MIARSQFLTYILGIPVFDNRRSFPDPINCSQTQKQKRVKRERTVSIGAEKEQGKHTTHRRTFEHTEQAGLRQQAAKSGESRQASAANVLARSRGKQVRSCKGDRRSRR